MRFFGVLVVLAACGGSSADIERSRHVAYKAEFQEVWKQVFTEVSDRYRGEIVRALPDIGLILSNWKRIESQRDTSTGSSRSPAEGVVTLGSFFFRHIIRVVPNGSGLVYVIADGEAAEYKAGNAVLIPFAHGSADEPQWVQGRIDDLRAAIYRRLAAYAVEAPATPPLTPRAPE